MSARVGNHASTILKAGTVPSVESLIEDRAVAAGEMLTIDELRKYLKRQWARYRRADRAGRSQLLSEMEYVTGLHRKSLVRLLAAPTLELQPERGQRGRSYD